MVKLRKPLVSYWSVYAVCFGVWASGALWLLLHYFFIEQTDFGLTHHPLEHWSLVAHGAFAFASLWLVGFLWGTHVVKRWRLRRHRKTGGVLFGVMCLLILTGYLLYYLSSDEWRASTSYVHWIIGLGMPLALLAHWLIRGR
jgi:hypothetical protein